MGTRINVVMEHTVTDYRNQSAVLARLEPTLPAALAIRNYWIANSDALELASESRWAADPILPHEKHYRSYTGPGSLYLKVGPRAAKIRTGGRWRGFLSITPLHQVHLQAFRRIAEALGATKFVCFPDCEDVWEVFYAGGGCADALPILEQYFGLPQPSLDSISAEVIVETDHAIPCVWYSEEVTSPHT